MVLRASPPPPRDPACPSRASGWWSRATVAGGFPCCIESPCTDMPSPVPRWTRWVKSLVGRRIPAGHLSPATTAFPRTQMGRRPRHNLSGPQRKFTCVTACLLAGPPSGPLRRRLRRLRYLHRRSDCYRLERPSCRAGVAPAEEAGSDCTCSPTLLKAGGPAYREPGGLAGLGRLVPALSAASSRSAPMRHALRRRVPPHPQRPASGSIRPPMSRPFGRP
jgi:hypothetical protein